MAEPNTSIMVALNRAFQAETPQDKIDALEGIYISGQTGIQEEKSESICALISYWMHEDPAVRSVVIKGFDRLMKRAEEPSFFETIKGPHEIDFDTLEYYGVSTLLGDPS